MNGFSCELLWLQEARADNDAIAPNSPVQAAAILSGNPTQDLEMTVAQHENVVFWDTFTHYNVLHMCFGNSL